MTSETYHKLPFGFRGGMDTLSAIHSLIENIPEIPWGAATTREKSKARWDHGPHVDGPPYQWPVDESFLEDSNGREQNRFWLSITRPQRQPLRSAIVLLTRSVEPMGRAITGWTPMPITAQVLPHHFLVFTLHLDHDRQASTTKGPQRYPRIEYGHQWLEHPEGGHEHHTSEPRLRLRGTPSHHDPGELPFPPR